jgi:hypothetical protein
MPRVLHITILAACVAIVILAFVLDVDDTGVYVLGWKWPMKCAMYQTFGVKCATCGLTRAICYAAHGQWHKASEMNAIWPVAAGVILLEIVYRLAALALWPTRMAKRFRVGHAVAISSMVAIIVCHWLVYLGGLL